MCAVSSPWPPLSTSLSSCRPCSFSFSSSSPTRSSWLSFPTVWAEKIGAVCALPGAVHPILEVLRVLGLLALVDLSVAEVDPLHVQCWQRRFLAQAEPSTKPETDTATGRQWRRRVAAEIRWGVGFFLHSVVQHSPRRIACESTHLQYHHPLSNEPRASWFWTLTNRAATLPFPYQPPFQHRRPLVHLNYPSREPPSRTTSTSTLLSPPPPLLLPCPSLCNLVGAWARATCIWRKMGLPFLYEVIAESLWRTMGWVYDDRSNAVDTLKLVFRWRNTKWWQSTQEGTDFGKSRLSAIDFGQFRLRPIFGCWILGPLRVGPQKGGAPKPRKSGAPKGGAPKGGVEGPKFRASFPSSRHNFLSSFFLLGSLRGILVVFEAPGPWNVHCLEFSGCRVRAPAARFGCSRRQDKMLLHSRLIVWNSRRYTDQAREKKKSRW